MIDSARDVTDQDGLPSVLGDPALLLNTAIGPLSALSQSCDQQMRFLQNNTNRFGLLKSTCTYLFIYFLMCEVKNLSGAFFQI